MTTESQENPHLLLNISKRYAIESRKEVLIQESNDQFVVKLPKLK